jgi:hypothetical protein
MGVNEEIRQANLERIKSIEFQFLEKSITNDLQYGIKTSVSESKGFDSGLSISKTGEEIKQKLQLELNRLSAIKAEDFTKMNILAKNIGVSPIKEIDSYRSQDWKGKVQIPLIYCYSQIYDEANRSDVAEAKQMRMYNELARGHFDKSIEERKLNTIINAIDDKKKYRLTVDIASKLGF